jgi:NitT/TauT family transport system ATP-binding protein
MSALLSVQRLSHRYPTTAPAAWVLRDISFAVPAGELVCIVGPSGCGKSTLLRCAAGLTTPTDGVVRLHGEPLAGVPADLAVVFQDYTRSLFPWLSVRGNVAFPLRWRVSGRAVRQRRAEEALDRVGLRDVAGRRPWQLSGGMQQRVAIARALASRPSLLLMDEPFASVDAQTRGELQDLLREIRRDRGTTVLVVTHDIDESVYLGDRVIALSAAPGRVAADIPIDLPAARDQITTRESAAFVASRGELARLLRAPARGLERIHD